jgi:hypothetical protein
VPATIGPLVGGKIYENEKSYDKAFYLAGGFCIAPALIQFIYLMNEKCFK